MHVYIFMCVCMYGCMRTNVLSPSLGVLIGISSCRQLVCLGNDNGHCNITII